MQPARTDGIPRVTEHPTSHEGRQPLAARSQERARPRQPEAVAGIAATAAVPGPSAAPGAAPGSAAADP
ncbi:hypothetical protein ABZV68_14025, partial [Streptomyces clavifer]|uniref:hypothetical protein n=1 Tax=Streptomyces clavifer TaxID=68188 RepID=UPI00339E3809